ncbi:MAG: D-sedoheptulose 7-phosphate isomerase [Hydrotalea flava]|uniref:D-sedoheptulose 7-phosphate isomerase n=1 Tax=Hydrotalea lipotrueae TaxID=2803817 RepID=UPI0016A17720|nr:D-sedoheptulose 7-phosphate isomerase [Hydrotalea lipotrueae]NIM33900.1 D-sedoheptulose 7-phosphate isomerase [Hydrotalea flava]NIM36729.1 D-sedoheptulose 7-phosphate isomerase [Hydrotalea flava]NIN01915.1 D-sedoheptulose 7-phosphate isomerase [Hydrotalea flava]NIN13573.1 D-sedoheptulose 7-phosphate isomerase [Hydrotalea flava]NIO92655.1 D-sedoheptulose 7-phosphate isomerase [Hydrotalea flava]
MQNKFKEVINASIEVKQAILQDANMLQNLEQAIELITNAFKNGNKVLFCGNGGSAADAQHLAAEFSGRFYKNRKALPSEALHCNTSYLTAVANDYSYDVIYARIIEGTGLPGDVLIGLSTSGNSPNILKAFEAAKTNQMITIGFTGSTGGKMKDCSDILFNVPSTDTPRIQESHIMLGHIICEMVEANLFT